MKFLQAGTAALTCLLTLPMISVADAQECTPPPENMLFWFAQDGQMAELIGNRTADVLGSPGQPADPWSNASAALGVTPGNYVQFASDAGMEIGAGDFTVDAWIRTRERSFVLPIVDKRNRDTPGYMFYVNNGNISMQTHSSVGRSFNVESRTNVADGEWHHVAAAIHRRERVVRLYVDGELVHTGNHIVPPGTSLDNDVPLRIGRGGYDESGRFDVDEVELFDRALTAREIAALARAPKCKDDGPVRGYDLTLTKEPIDGDAGWQTGTQQSFAIVVQNQSGSASLPSGAVVVDDAVPQNYTAYSVSGPSGSAWNCPGNQFPCSYGAVQLSSGDSLPPLTITGTVGQGNMISNCATVAHLQGETTHRNNQSCTRVRITEIVTPPPVLEPCCAPMGDEVASVFRWYSVQGVADPYRVEFTPGLNPPYETYMQAYANYATTDPVIASVQVSYTLTNALGTVLQTGTVTYQNGTNSASGTFFTTGLTPNGGAYTVTRTVALIGPNGGPLDLLGPEECPGRGFTFTVGIQQFRTSAPGGASSAAVINIETDQGSTRQVRIEE